MSINTFQSNRRLAQRIWGKLPVTAIRSLEELTKRFSLSVASGDLLLIDGHWYVTHTGLLRLAGRHHCIGIRVSPVKEFCNTTVSRWVFKATVYKSSNCKGFVGYGDADPSNVSPLVRGAEMRVAETRAVNRALRKAYGIGICSVEEIGSFAETAQTSRESKKLLPQPANGITAAPKFATASAGLSASISLIPPWSRPTRLTSAGPRPCARQHASRSRILSSIWPIGLRKTGMPCFACSTVMAGRKAQHEASDRRSP